MKFQKSSAWILTMVALLLCAAAGYAVEFYDHPRIGRYEGSAVIHQESSGLNQYTLGLGAAKDGKVAQTPENASSFEIFSAYRQLLRSEGFEVLLEGGKAECGEKFLGAFYDLAPFANDPGWNHSAPITQGNPEASYVLVAGSGSGEPATYVSLIVSQGWHQYPVYKLDVVETRGQTGGISSRTGAGKEAEDEASGSASSGKAARRKAQLGIQMASDSSLGLLLCANRFEICAKFQAVIYDGFPGDDWPDNSVLMAGGHAMYLFRPGDRSDIGIGMDIRQGITLAKDPVDQHEYVQYMDAGARISFNYHFGGRFMVSGIMHPFWLVVRETDVADSYNMTIKTPTAAMAVSFF